MWKSAAAIPRFIASVPEFCTRLMKSAFVFALTFVVEGAEYLALRELHFVSRAKSTLQFQSLLV
jgi:hypothetical protein